MNEISDYMNGEDPRVTGGDFDTFHALHLEDIVFPSVKFMTFSKFALYRTVCSIMVVYVQRCVIKVT